MSLLIKSPKDFWTGVLYLAFGAIALWIARDYPIGTAGRMGPGYFPTALSLLLMGLGVYILAKGLTRAGDPLGRFAWRGALLVLGATVAFGVLLETAGLIVALIVLIFGSAMASVKTKLDWQSVALAVGLIVFCVLVFVKGLGVSMPLLGSWFGA
jgi:hypothetical protein